MMTLKLLLLACQAASPPPVGAYEGTLRDKDGVMMRVAMRTPERFHPLRRMSLLLVFHGMNGNEKNYYRGMTEALPRVGLADRFVLICGKSKGAGWKVEDDGPVVLRLIEWAKASYPIEPRRIYIWGSSNGAGFVGRFGWANQDKVAAVVGYCGGYNFRVSEAPKDPAATRTEWYFVHGGDDNPENSRRGCDQLRDMSYRYVFRQLDGYGHTDIWSGQGHPDTTLVDAVRDDTLRWMDALRHKEIGLVKADGKLLEPFSDPKKAERLLRRKAVYPELARIGGPQAGAVILSALTSKIETVRITAATTCGHALFGPAVARALAELVDDGSTRVRFAALQSLGVYANYRYASAQSALCRVAFDAEGRKGGRIRERLLALAGLGKGVALALAGNFEDGEIFRTLVDLLDDKDGRVRAAAFAALKGAVKGGFGYDPRLSEKARAASIARWKDWCGRKCGPKSK